MSDEEIFNPLGQMVLVRTPDGQIARIPAMLLQMLRQAEEREARGAPRRQFQRPETKQP